MPYFICPNCKQRSIDNDGLEGFSQQTVQCRSCGFGFLFELMDDYYPSPAAGFVVCDEQGRVLATGRGVFELTKNPVKLALEWDVRRLGEELQLRTRAGIRKPVRADFFPAYDRDGGLLMALAPR
jgi:hypothetical protein